MRIEEDHQFGFDTRQLHAGQRPEPDRAHEGERPRR